MRIICLIKIVPNVDNFKYDHQHNTLIRDRVKMILNPDDVCALAFALKMKAKDPTCFIEVVTMAPMSVTPHLEDLLRLHVDKGTIISDKVFGGSDTYVTSTILSRYLETADYDCILSGTYAIDGDTSHVPAQIGEILDLNQMSGIIRIDEESFCEEKAVFDVESETCISTYETPLPAILSLQKESKYKLPYVKYEDLIKDVKNQLNIVSNHGLAFDVNEVGIKGSLTKVNRTYVKAYDKREKVIVHNDDEGIQVVYSFLKDNGYV